MAEKNVYERKIVKVGNSFFISIPSDVVKRKKIKHGELAILEYDDVNGMLYVWF